MIEQYKRIIIATSNENKKREIRYILEQYKNIRILDLPNNITKKFNIDETGTTFVENAIIKAKGLAKLLNNCLELKNEDVYILSDDSGIEIDALNGEPGVLSGRYGHFDNPDNLNKVEKLLKKMDCIKNRKATFTGVIAILHKKTNKLQTYVGIINGIISEQKARGITGFDYDILFIPEGYKKTLSELSIGTKNSISHRYNGIKKAIFDINNNYFE